MTWIHVFLGTLMHLVSHFIHPWINRIYKPSGRLDSLVHCMSLSELSFHHLHHNIFPLISVSNGFLISS